MKRRPTEIPYIPKDKRRSRFAPRQGGKILKSNNGVEALRQTNAGSSVKQKKEKQGGCGCLFFIFFAWAIFSDDGMRVVQDLIEDMGTRLEISVDD